jgi:hypothetical protein
MFNKDEKQINTTGHTVGTIANSNVKSVESCKIDNLTHKYMTDHFPGLVQAL